MKLIAISAICIGGLWLSGYQPAEDGYKGSDNHSQSNGCQWEGDDPITAPGLATTIDMQPRRIQSLTD
jgi:hypothetical protein